MARKEYESEYRRNRPLVLERDGNCCVKCGSGLCLEVHHIEGYKNAELEALVTLCYLCHNIAPMGRDEFAQWLLIGESGIESVERKISQNGVNKLSRATIWKVLTALVELGVETNKSRMKAARDRIRVSGSKCEGQKRYGYFPEEKPVLAEMKRLRDRGLTFDNIAALLNEENIPSRKGGLWAGCTINKILKRDNSRIEEIEPKKKIEREKALDNMLRFSYKCTNEEN